MADSLSPSEHFRWYETTTMHAKGVCRPCLFHSFSVQVLFTVHFSGLCCFAGIFESSSPPFTMTGFDLLTAPSQTETTERMF